MLAIIENIWFFLKYYVVRAIEACIFAHAKRDRAQRANQDTSRGGAVGSSSGS